MVPGIGDILSFASGGGYMDAAARLAQNIMDAASATGVDHPREIKGTDDESLDPDIISAFKSDLTEKHHTDAKTNMYKRPGMTDDEYKKYVSHAHRTHKSETSSPEIIPAEIIPPEKKKRVRKPRTTVVPPIFPDLPTPQREDIVNVPMQPESKRQKTIPPTYAANAPIIFNDERLSKTAPISSVDLYGNMAWQGMQQLGLMGLSTYMGTSPEAASLMYQGLHTMNKLYNQRGATPTELAASQGLEAAHELVAHGGVVKAVDKFKSLQRGELESITTVNQQIITAFAKGLKSSNSVKQAQQAVTAQYRAEFGGA
jgi:hypothetical protein